MDARWSAIAFALFRIVAGLLFASHGAQKLFAVFGGPAATGKPLLLTAGVIELVGGLLVAVGLFARPAAFVASGEMAVAYFMAHAPGGFWPIVNKGEAAVFYCFAFLFIAAHGAGIWSLDSLRLRSAPASVTRPGVP
ncbi:MAG TPA: DoxX family protein [Thermoanaerobaculia bacterium]|jgi:putative oxidoreductase|nr:DoxX family protein [Thermoanaerobaculia bacterium]